MKKISIILYASAIFALLGGCADKTEFTVNGTLDNQALNGKTLYLTDLYGESQLPFDSTVVADGTFSFRRFASEVSVGAKCRSAIAPVSLRFISSGRRSMDRSSATCLLMAMTSRTAFSMVFGVIP